MTLTTTTYQPHRFETKLKIYSTRRERGRRGGGGVIRNGRIRYFEFKRQKAKGKKKKQPHYYRIHYKVPESRRLTNNTTV